MSNGFCSPGREENGGKKKGGRKWREEKGWEKMAGRERVGENGGNEVLGKVAK